MSKTDTVQVALKGTDIRPDLCQYHQAKNINVYMSDSNKPHTQGRRRAHN